MAEAAVAKRPLCFVLMPFGRKPGTGGAILDFDAIYADLIKPAVSAAGLEPIRADEEQAGGVIHKPMFERLILCEYAVADLTTANANVFYELGVRHAVRPWATLLVFAEDGTRLPFDVGPLRGLSYTLGADGKPAPAAADRQRMTELLVAARQRTTDSPVFQLVPGFPDVRRIEAEVFRERVDASQATKAALETARRTGLDAVRAVEAGLGPVHDSEAGVLIDLLLSYRDGKAWDDMIRLAAAMPEPLRRTVLVQEQLGFALNRAGRGEEAERVFTELVARRGPSSETYGLLGRVYKDRWETAAKAGDRILARGLLDKAIGAYLRGFEADWRDAFPGVNAVTLMTVKTPPDPRVAQLLPIVRYAVERRIASGEPGYWDHATLLELAVLGNDEPAATTALADAVAVIRAPWEPETTARNLRLIREAREARGDIVPWARDIEAELVRKAED